ncbi:MAG TPA: acyltransferase [Pseudonocardiaceae bacterium]|jgi:peptidoglycan/LPS O-acetylase OafA/YrhL
MTTAPTPGAKKQHLHYIDLVRVLTVALVIAVHVLGQEPLPPTLTAGALLAVGHVSREVFFLLTAFVLIYTYRSKPVRPLSFWRKRFLYVGVPYVAWSLIYFLADNAQLDPISSAALTFGHSLLDGAARYHLYFLLVSMQIYLVFPLIRALLKATRRHHLVLLGLAGTYQILFYLAVQLNISIGPLTGLLRSPDAWLTSYLGFVIAGGIAAWHAEALVDWTRARMRWVFTGCLATIGIGLAVFFGEVFIGGQSSLTASDVFQPVTVIESVGIAWAFLALGLRWQDRGRRAGRLVSAGGDASFGIYLVHPLLIQGLFMGTSTIGLTALAQGAPTVAVLVEMVVFVPLLYLGSGVLAVALRRTPFSLSLAGRARLRRPEPAPVRVPLPFSNCPLPTQGGTS